MICNKSNHAVVLFDLNLNYNALAKICLKKKKSSIQAEGISTNIAACEIGLRHYVE